MTDKKELNKAYYDTSAPSTPYGGSNPYSYCNSCEISMIEVSYAGHFEDCSWVLSQLKPMGKVFNLKELRKISDLIYIKICSDDFDEQDSDYQDFMNGMLAKVTEEINNNL